MSWFGMQLTQLRVKVLQDLYVFARSEAMILCEIRSHDSEGEQGSSSKSSIRSVSLID